MVSATMVQLLSPFRGVKMAKLLVFLSGLLLCVPAFAANPSFSMYNPSVTNAPALAAGGNTIRPISAHFSDVIYVRDRAVKCDGVTDDTAAINAITSNLPSNTEVIFPPGKCMFSATLIWRTNASTIIGSGRSATQFVYNGSSTTNDLIFSSSPTPGSALAMVGDFTILSQTTMTAGAALHMQLGNTTKVENIVTGSFNGTNTLWNGLWIDQPNVFFLDGFYLTDAQNDNLDISAMGIGTGNQYGVYVDNGKIGGGAVGIHIGGGMDNMSFENMEVTSNVINVLDDNAIEPFKNQEIYFGKTVTTDMAGTYDYYINDTDADQSNYCIIEIDGPVTDAKGNDDIDINAAPTCNIEIGSPWITSAARDGIRISDASAYVSISSNTFIYNNHNYGMNATVPYTHLLSMGTLYANGANGPADGLQTSSFIDSSGTLAGIAQSTTPTAGQPVIYELVNNSTASSPTVAEYAMASAEGDIKSDIFAAVGGSDWMRFCAGGAFCGPSGGYQVGLAGLTSTTGQWLPAVADGMSLGSSATEWGPAYLSTLNEFGTFTAADSGTWSSTGISGTRINNSPIGATMASTGAFTTLSANGNDAINANSNTSGESIPSGSSTAITGWTTKFDRVGTNWNAATGKFTAPTAGIFIVSTGITFSPTTATVGSSFSVRVIGPSGAIYCMGNAFASTTASISYSVSTSCAVQTSGIEGITVEAYQNTGSAVTLSAVAAVNYISIYRLP